MPPSGHVALLVLSVLLHQSPQVLGSGISQCNSTLTSPTGEIRSLNYPDPYPGGVTCLWHITFGNVSNVTGITLFSKHYSTQITNSVSLFEEELLIYTRNPSSVNATPAVYRGQYVVYQSPQNYLWLQFTSAENITVRRTDGNFLGFDILYTAVIPGEYCPNLDLPQNTVRIGNHTHVGSYYDYYCNHGYRLVGPSVLLCVLQGGVATWSADTSPSCVDTCTVPTVNNGDVSYPNLHVNSSATFTCTPPYMLNGSSVVVCSTDSQGLPSWNGEFPQCVIPDCSEVVVLREDRGALVNPGYATHSVQSGKNCRWQITVKTGLVVHLYFRYFHLPADRGSSLQVADVGDERVSLLTLAGGQQPRNVTSATNQVEIDYHGPLTNSTSHDGFYIQYEMGSAGDLGQGHGPITPFIPPKSATTTTPIKTTTQKGVTATYVEDGSGTIKIAVGVAVPVVILLAVSLGLYLWYRKKYPVRMIIGREFAKFSNPDYNVKGTSTLTLVRDDADDFFKTASRATSNVNLVVDQQQGPHYVNVGFKKGENGEISGIAGPEELDQDEEDRELMKRKSYLFTPVNMSDTESAKKKDEESSSDSDSASEAGSHSGGSQSSRKTKDVVVTVEHEQDVAVDIESSSDKQLLLSQSDIDSFNSHFPNRPIRKISVGVLLEQSKDRRAFTNEERPQRRFSFDASLSVRGRSLSAKTPAEVSKDAEKLDALLKRSRFSQMTSVEETDDKSDKPEDDVDGRGDGENKDDKEIKRTRMDDHAYENQVVYEAVTVVPNPAFLQKENVIYQNSTSPEFTNSHEKTEDVVSETRPKVPEQYENVLVQDNKITLEDTTQYTEETPDGDTCKDSKDMIPAVQSINVSEREVDSNSHGETLGEISNPQHVQDVDQPDDSVSKSGNEKLNTSSAVPPKQEEGESLFRDEIDGSQVTKVVSESEESDQEDGRKETNDSSELHVETDSIHAGETGVIDNEEDVAYENAAFIKKSDPDVDNQYENTDLKQRLKSASLNQEDYSTDDSASESSTSSNVSGTYNFGRTPPESDEDNDDDEEEVEEEEVVEKEEGDKTAGDTNNVDQTKEQNVIVSAESDTVSSTKEVEDLADHESDVSGSGHKPGVNLDNSSISSLDQSVLDTSVELSTTSADSPVMQKRPPTSTTTTGPTRKVAAPVFSIGGDDDDPSSDVSSNDSDDEGNQRRRDSRTGTSVMPGIEEEDTDSDKGHSRSYNFGHGDDDSDSDNDGGRKFTDDDLLAELSDDSGPDEQDKKGKSVVPMTPGMFVFDENLDDDLNV